LWTTPFGDPSARTLLRMDELIRLTRGLYRPAETVSELGDRCAAFLDVMPSGTVVGGITAARLHGLWLPEANGGERIELIQSRGEIAPRQLPGSRRSEVHVRRRTLRPDEIAEVDGIPVTTEARTWIDLAESLRLEDLVAAGDSVLHPDDCSADLAAAVRDGFHRRGVLRARQALTLLDRRSRSRPESHLRLALVLGGLPCPEVNSAIYTEHGEWLAEPDLHYKRARLMLEYNGRDHADVDRMRADITRELDADSNEWHVAVFGPAQVFGRPYRIAGYVRHLLDRRDPGWSQRLAS
jgi:hypothetical protein